MSVNPAEIASAAASLSRCRIDDIKSIVGNYSENTSRRMAAIQRLTESDLPNTEKACLLKECLYDEIVEVKEMTIFSLSCLREPILLEELRKLIWDSDPSLQLEALRALARFKEKGTYNSCAHFISHGDSERRKAAIIALGILGTEESVSLLELIWDSTNMTSDERMLVALTLAKHGSRSGESFLENALDRNQDRKMIIATALARLRNRVGLLELNELLMSASEVDIRWAQMLMADYFGVDPDLGDQWHNRVSALIDAKLTESEAS